MPRIESRIQHTSGIPLGGIGTGSVEIRPDGCFHEWQIFNLGAWAPWQPDTCKSQEPESGPDSLSFFVWCRERGQTPVMRRLSLRSDAHDLYHFAWLRSVQSIGFSGTYPVARLRYLDDDLPVGVEALLFSPFIPHDSRASGTPGFHAVFAVTNRSGKPLDVSLLATLRNPLAWGAADRRLVNAVTTQGRTTFLTLRTEADIPARSTLGSLCLSVTGGRPSWSLGDFSNRFGAFHVSHWGGIATPYGMFTDGLFVDYRNRGALPSLPGDRSPANLLTLTDRQILDLSPAGKRRLVRECRRHPFGEAVWARARTMDPDSLRTDEGLASFLTHLRVRLDRLAGQDRRRQNWGDCGLNAELEMRPGATQEARFALSWHFPYHYSQFGPVLGHQYENWFRDAEAVNRFLVTHREAHRKTVVHFAETLFDTSLPPELPDSWAGQLTTIPKCTWWTRDGQFGVWEGLGCCGFHTTDITYQGSFSLLALFPDLQKRQMEMGARFQRADGRVHHFFRPDFSSVDSGFDRVDMNQQFVLLVCRDYLWTGDKAYVRRLWPNIVRAMECTAELDRDGDGLPDHDTRRNTYDGWDFTGTPSYIASLWLSALLAAARLADELGHRRQASAWRRQLAKGVRRFDAKLWNGEYYSLWVDGAVRDECCMTDQIDGEWFTQLIGLGHALPERRIVQALRAIFRHNFREEGLINASYPARAKPRLCTHNNFQAMAPWTGIEHAIASMMMDFGLTPEAMAVVRNIHERHLRAGRFWNHVECGNHYYRAMSSWALLLAATGFRLDAPRHSLTVAPAFEDSPLRAPWVSSTGWGTLDRTDSTFAIRVNAGSLSLRELRLGMKRRPASVICAGKRVPARVGRAGAIHVVRLAQTVTLKPGDELVAARE